jgi:hypothetical protein
LAADVTFAIRGTNDGNRRRLEKDIQIAAGDVSF